MRAFARSVKRSCPPPSLTNSNIVLSVSNAHNSRLLMSPYSIGMRQPQAHLLSYHSNFCTTTKEGETKVNNSTETTEKVSEEKSIPEAAPKPEGSNKHYLTHVTIMTERHLAHTL